MNQNRIMISILFLATMGVLFVGCSSPSQEIVLSSVKDGPEKQSDYIFFDDFSEDAIGAVPKGWTISNGAAEIVPAPDLPSGKAVRVSAGSEYNGVDTHFKASTWSERFDRVNTIAVEYRLKRIQGGTNLNISSNKGHHVNFHVAADGTMEYRESKLRQLPNVAMVEGWNLFRFTANRERGEVFLYLNDMETPIAGPLPFRTPIESWANAHFYLLHDKIELEFEYGEFKVWAVN